MTTSNQSLNLWLEDLHRDQVGLRLRLRDCLFSGTSPFQRIAVYDSLSFGRILTLGGSIALTDYDEQIYSECLVHPALSVAPNPEHVLILGGGDGGVAREVLRYAKVKKVTVVEIDKQVVDACKKWFPNSAAGLADKRVDLVIDDAHRYLRDTKDQFDVIIVDACELVNPASDAFHAVTFSQSVFRCLKNGGILMAPLGCPLYDAESCRSTLRALSEKFHQPAIYTMPLPSQPAGQLAVAWCSTSAKPIQNKEITESWHKDLRSWHPKLQAALFTLPRHIQQQLGLSG